MIKTRVSNEIAIQAVTRIPVNLARRIFARVAGVESMTGRVPASISDVREWAARKIEIKTPQRNMDEIPTSVTMEVGCPSVKMVKKCDRNTRTANKATSR